MTDPASAEALNAAALSAFGKIDILINNTGITRDDLIMRMRRASTHPGSNTQVP